MMLKPVFPPNVLGVSECVGGAAVTRAGVSWRGPVTGSDCDSAQLRHKWRYTRGLSPQMVLDPHSHTWGSSPDTRYLSE